MRCAVPQTGSSGRPTLGAKTRMTMSHVASPGAVAITALRSKAAMRDEIRRQASDGIGIGKDRR